MTNDWQVARDKGARLLDEGDYEGAINKLQGAVAGDPGGKSHALLGLAHYQREEYAKAATHYDLIMWDPVIEIDGKVVQRGAEILV